MYKNINKCYKYSYELNCVPSPQPKIHTLKPKTNTVIVFGDGASGK